MISSWVAAVSIGVNLTDPSCGIEGVAGKADAGVTLNETVTNSSCKSLVGRCGDDECGGQGCSVKFQMVGQAEQEESRKATTGLVEASISESRTKIKPQGSEARGVIQVNSQERMAGTQIIRVGCLMMAST